MRVYEMEINYPLVGRSPQAIFLQQSNDSVYSLYDHLKEYLSTLSGKDTTSRSGKKILLPKLNVQPVTWENS